LVQHSVLPPHAVVLGLQIVAPQVVLHCPLQQALEAVQAWPETTQAPPLIAQVKVVVSHAPVQQPAPFVHA
jgi:hypothetical protein